MREIHFKPLAAKVGQLQRLIFTKVGGLYVDGGGVGGVDNDD